MVAVNYSTIRDNLKSYCDKVTDENETVIVTRKEEKNVVIISLAEWNALKKMERNAQYLHRLDRAMEQLNSGGGVEHDIIEVDDNE